jgi:Ca2+-binding RTX toxin-like protein
VPLRGPARGRDSFDGGKGADTVSYEARLADVRVDLIDTSAKAGARGERDAVRNVEHVVGGPGDDRLSGTPRTNHFEGAEGDDVILGRGGQDFLEGGAGSNVIFGGPGADQINQALGPPGSGEQRISCGTDLDLVGAVLSSDFVNDDCETLELGFGNEPGRFVNTVMSHLPLREGAEPRVLSVPIPGCFGSSQCMHHLEVLVHGPAAGHETAPPSGTILGAESASRWWYEQSRPATLSLSPEGLKTVRRYRALNVRVLIREGGSGASSAYLTVLRAP